MDKPARYCDESSRYFDEPSQYLDKPLRYLDEPSQYFDEATESFNELFKHQAQPSQLWAEGFEPRDKHSKQWTEASKRCNKPARCCKFPLDNKRLFRLFYALLSRFFPGMHRTGMPPARFPGSGPE